MNMPLGMYRSARLVAVVLVLAVVSPLAGYAQSAKLTFLHINDVYEISPRRGIGGLAELMTLLRQERAQAENHITTLGGDLVSPSVMSGLTKGKQMIALMNAIGVDYAGLGNHEFDFGDDLLKQRLSESKFSWLATNTLENGKPFGGMAATAVRDIGEFKVGFFSVLTPETTHLSSPGSAITFAPVEDAAKQAIATLKEQGAHFIVALTHLDLAQDRALARALGDIDIILGGHDHDPIMIYEGSTLILKAGTDAHFLAVADVTLIKGESRGTVTYSFQPEWRLRTTAGVQPDPEVAALTGKYNAELDAELSIPVGKAGVELDSRRASVRTRETTMGNLIADAMRASVTADIALTNGGGIRGDRTYDAGSTLTRKDVLTELPFGNVTVVLELKGSDLLAALENGVSRIEDTAGRFPQVSGVRFSFDSTKPAGSRVSDVNVGGQALDANKLYRVATNDFIAGGGDGFDALTAGRVIVDAAGATLIATMVMDYISANGTVTPKVDGRISGR
ncbi:MAG: 5'-nucleotidase C-terminal domain-containing protein [Proteobacteria bacterium]|nr:5'-nucleotidase C-terminal domain-containing protein [Pseudomonadota bacterium]MDA1058685.1 5'-nucleotidase C-terminal domain-containing protein [Pseudomonadota bacterium]